MLLIEFSLWKQACLQIIRLFSWLSEQPFFLIPVEINLTKKFWKRAIMKITKVFPGHLRCGMLFSYKCILRHILEKLFFYFNLFVNNHLKVYVYIYLLLADNPTEVDDLLESSVEIQEEDSTFNQNSLVFNFLNSCSADEVAVISGVSRVKADQIVSLQPFDNWEILVRFFVFFEDHMRCFARFCTICSLKNVKNTHGGVLLLVKLQFWPAKSNISPWVFSCFLNSTNGTKARNAYVHFIDLMARYIWLKRVTMIIINLKKLNTKLYKVTQLKA